jgi:hypothetical protein
MRQRSELAYKGRPDKFTEAPKLDNELQFDLVLEEGRASTLRVSVYLIAGLVIVGWYFGASIPLGDIFGVARSTASDPTLSDQADHGR